MKEWKMAGRKTRTAHETPALNRGNLERAAQLARRAAGELEELIKFVQGDDLDEWAGASAGIATAKATLGDALTELGEGTVG